MDWCREVPPSPQVFCARAQVVRPVLDPEALQRATLSFVLKGLEFHRGGPAGRQDGGLKLKTLLCGRDFLSV